jgi:uncharacterized membrane protein YhhN
MSASTHPFFKYKRYHMAILCSAVIVVAGRFFLPSWPWLNYVFKPLTTLLIGLLAVVAPVAQSNRYKKFLIIGLLFSLAGDIFLMLPRQLFLTGLFSFLVTHLCYLAAFLSDARPSLHFSSPLLFLPGVFVFWEIRSGISPQLLVPVLVYLICITVMAHQACMRALGQHSRSAWLAAAGALLFVASDSLLAINKFHVHFANAGIWVLSTYYLAQWLIAVSLHYYTPNSTSLHDADHR